MRFWARVGAAVAACVVVGVAVSLLLFVGWLHAPRSHVVQAFEYLVTSGLVSTVAGGAALLLVDRFVPRLGIKIAVASLVGSAAAILNVIWTPLLMFSEQNDRNILVVTLLYFLAISLAFAFLVAAATTRKIRDLHEGAVKLAAGEFDTHVEVQGLDEVADLSRAFNRMSHELGVSFDRQRRLEAERRDLIAAVSHDLRTPLTSMRAMIEAINDGVVSDADTVQRYLRLIQGESERLGTLIEDLFELVRIDSGNLELRLNAVPLSELVEGVLAGMRVQAEDKGVRLESRYEQDAPAAVDAARMERVLVNLVDNALRHTPRGGCVRVTVARHDDRVRLAVSDTGEGISAEDQEHVFERFYRGEKSRSREGGGTGLGLAIARGIVEAHGGSIELKSMPGNGSEFVVEMAAVSS